MAVELDGMTFGSGYILFAASYSEEAIEEAKAYCRKYGLTPKNVMLKKVRKKESDLYELVLVEVI
jgi:hypothetical protein